MCSHIVAITPYPEPRPQSEGEAGAPPLFRPMPFPLRCSEATQTTAEREGPRPMRRRHVCRQRGWTVRAALRRP